MVRSSSALLTVLCAILVSVALHCDGARVHSLKPVSRTGILLCTRERNGCYKKCAQTCAPPSWWPGEENGNCQTNCSPGCYKKGCVELVKKCSWSCKQNGSSTCYTKCRKCCNSKGVCTTSDVCDRRCYPPGCGLLATKAVTVDWVVLTAAK